MYQSSLQKMRVLKRSGQYEEVSFDKILTRIKSLSQGSEFSKKLSIDETLIAQKVVQEIYDGVKTTDLDELSSQIAISMYSKDPEFKTLASRIIISNHHKNTLNNFSDKIELMYHYKNNGVKKPLIADYFYEFVMSNKDKINEMNYKNNDLQELNSKASHELDLIQKQLNDLMNKIISQNNNYD